MAPKSVSDPGLYRRLSEPRATVAEAQEAADKFYEEVCQLREKHQVPDLVLAFSINARNEQGEEVSIPMTGYRGGPRCERLIVELMKSTRFGEALLVMIDELTIAALR